MEDLIYLKHHGILGQKWGIRRYQNPDGTLTNEGKKRYGKYLNDDSSLTEAGKKKIKRDCLIFGKMWVAVNSNVFKMAKPDNVIKFADDGQRYAKQYALMNASRINNENIQREALRIHNENTQRFMDQVNQNNIQNQMHMMNIQNQIYQMHHF
jgi:hypothetical protein